MSRWVDVCDTTTLFQEQKKAFVIENIPVLIIHIDDTYYAIKNQCTHENFPLTDGEIEKDQIICPFHGAKFCFKTGEVTAPPAFDNIETFPVRVLNGQLQIDLLSLASNNSMDS